MSDFIKEIIEEKYSPRYSKKVYNAPLIQYLVRKTTSVNASSKARGSFANLYALYVLIEDYIQKGFLVSKQYKNYDGMMFKDAFKRQRELPFGQSLQNHALNSRCNDEFRKFFTALNEVPIIRNLDTKRYWINEKLLLVGDINISEDVINIIDTYVNLKREGFNTFFETCLHHKENYRKFPDKAEEFILSLLDLNVDARIFEIVSFCITKYAYHDRVIFYGESEKTLRRIPLTLYKTGRTNANDGGIDFIMKPLGRVFQVTEVLDFRKYFLDIEKLNQFPITFVIKTNMSPEEVMEKIIEQAKAEYPDQSVYKRYLAGFEEIITIETLKEYLQVIIKQELLEKLLTELIIQCKVEYNID
ncbi:hypothetical protein AA0X95_11105 [Bacillus sp. 1P10SD]|uniref:hypothetical protein n=1 Tax=Bacillus sp. 1P10SD TaxID=3132265 RepID=UPI0039A4B229